MTVGTNYIKVTAGSDDLVYLTVFENGRTMFDDELGSSNDKFEVNGHFIIYVNHGNTGSGWVIGIEVIEDALNHGQFKDAYSISITMDDNGYTPLLTVKTDENIVIKGHYGDKQSKVREALQKSNRLDYSDIDEVIKILEKNDLLK